MLMMRLLMLLMMMQLLTRPLMRPLMMMSLPTSMPLMLFQGPLWRWALQMNASEMNRMLQTTSNEKMCTSSAVSRSLG